MGGKMRYLALPCPPTRQVCMLQSSTQARQCRPGEVDIILCLKWLCVKYGNFSLSLPKPCSTPTRLLDRERSSAVVLANVNTC